MPEDKEMLDACLKNGAFKAYIVDVKNIPFDESLRSYCEANQCDCYGKNYGCPPFVGETKHVIAEAKSYNRALVYQTVGSLTDSYDFEGMKNAMLKHSEIANKIGEEIALDIGKHLDLRAGPCVACDECAALTNEPCRYPDKKRVSLEAYCINVTDLAKLCNMKYINGTNTVTYFGAFLMGGD